MTTREEVHAELKRGVNARYKGVSILITDVPVDNLILAGLYDGTTIDMYIDGSHPDYNSWMPSTQRGYWKDNGYNYTTMVPYSTLHNPILLGGE